jgi:hypothetical protein
MPSYYSLSTNSAHDVRSSSFDIMARRGHFPEREQPHKPKDAYLFRCPFHADTHPDFSLHEDRMRWKCWVCGIGGGPGELLKFLGDNYVPPPQPALSLPQGPAAKPKQAKSKGSLSFTGCTLDQLAKAKGLPVEYLRSLGWRDTNYYGRVVVAIPWPGGMHYRVNLDERPKYHWKSGNKVSILGLDQLEEIRRTGWVLIVEGETDYAAGRSMGLPVVAIPGASTWQNEWAFQFQGCQVFVWQEPDSGGPALVKKLVESFWCIKVVEPPEGIKDLCDLYNQAGEGAVAYFNDLKLLAREACYSRPDHDATEVSSPEPYYMEGSDGPRRRFPLPTDRGHIDKLRDRQSEIWLEAQRRLGNVDEVNRAHRCGGLYTNECDRRHVSAPEEKERLNCKQRLHPRCLGTNAQKVFYFRKTRGPTKIDAAGDMDIYIPCLGHFDLGEDPFYWPVNIRRQLQCVRKHVKKLARRRSTPQGFKDSFVGLRADLHQGYLTIDLVIAGGRDPGLPQWLKEAFAEIATVPVTVDTLHPRNPKKVINQFGNLMSSAFTYSDVEECLAMLEALKGWRVVQPQGKFHKNTALAEDQCSIVPIGDPLLEDPIETNKHPTSGGGASIRPPCPECGDPTHSGGFRTGRWVKVLGDWSKQLTWLLLEDDTDPGGGPSSGSGGEGFEDLHRDTAYAREEQLLR